MKNRHPRRVHILSITCAALLALLSLGLSGTALSQDPPVRTSSIPQSAPATSRTQIESPPADVVDAATDPSGPVARLLANARARDRLLDAWRRVRAAGTYRFTSSIDETVRPRAVPEMIGQGPQSVELRMRGAVALPDHAYLDLWAEQASEVAPVTLIRSGQTTLMSRYGKLEPVEDPLSIIAPNGDWLGYLVLQPQIADLGLPAPTWCGFQN